MLLHKYAENARAGLLMKKLVPLLVLLIFFSAHGSAVLEKDSMKIYAVTSDGTALVANLAVEIEQGSGRIWSEVGPLVGTTTQSAERSSLEVAGKYSTEVNKYDYKFTIGSDASVVEGPSAGAAMALLVVSMLKDKNLPDSVSITGTVDDYGNVGPVGGVFAKSKEASITGIELFLIPKGEARQTVKLEDGVQSINLLEYGPKEWGMKIAEVSNIDDALKYAYSDIEALDVNVTPAEAAPEFIPKKITIPRTLSPMKELTGDYIEEAKALVSQARISLSTTLLEDSSLISALLDILNSADKTLQTADMLYGQNYLYSAANYAFLVKVNASLVKDISDNPSLLSLDSSAFDMKVSSLRDDVRKLKSELSRSVPVDYWEYHTAAQQRLAYAENAINNLLTTQTVVVNGAEADAALERMRDYEFAYAWYLVAENFHELDADSEKQVKPGTEFSDALEQYIITAEDGLAVLGSNDTEDIERRLNAAKSEKRSKFYVASMFDAVSAISLINGGLATKDADLNSLYTLLSGKIASVEANMLGSDRDYVWAKLYLDHAKYYKEAADFYYSQNLGNDTISALRSGVSLIMLAENFLPISDSVYDYYESIKPEQYIGAQVAQPSAIVQQPGGIASIMQSEQFIAFLIVFALVMVLLILLVGKAVLRETRHPRTIPAEIRYVEMLKKATEQNLAKGRISKEMHDEKVAGYEELLKKLNELRASKAIHMLELDRMTVEFTGFKVRLRELRRHYSEGLLSEDIYKKMMADYSQRISELRRQISAEDFGIGDSTKELEKIEQEVETFRKKPEKARQAKQKPAGKAASK